MPRVTLIDNYDSFTWNLVHDLGRLGAEVDVVRNDAVSARDVVAGEPDAIVLSPGPATPNEAGICLDVIAQATAIPIFGVCLGLQAMGQAFGGEVVRAPLPMHGKVSTIHHRGEGVFRGINGPLRATRYHSLIVQRETLPAALAVTAESEDGLVMGLQHRARPVHGVQFHPESILSEHGLTIFKNFLDLAADWNRTRRVAVPA
ncbi:MAG: aminodeoxychorismate/anthranilate synthase component II [Alsobacter sp.]